MTQIIEGRKNYQQTLEFWPASTLIQMVEAAGAHTPTWAEYRALLQRASAVAECREAAGEEPPCAELMRVVRDNLDNGGPVRPPSNARRLNPPTALDGLSDDLVMRMFSRAPFMTHGTLHGVCRRLKTLLRSREFLQPVSYTHLTLPTILLV